MCFGPSAPPPIPQRQAQRSPTDVAGQTQANLARRMGLASTILTGPSGALGAATTTGKTLLGA
jgi:hypothetical protein